jgi:hypothetical protein
MANWIDRILATCIILSALNAAAGVVLVFFCYGWLAR